MLAPKKRDWIEIVLHVAFWVGVFYTLTSLTESYVKVRINHNGMILEKDSKLTISPHTFLTVGFLALLFYGNIFWVFKKALRYKNIISRIAISAGWFLAVFLANYYLVNVDAPVHDGNQPAMRNIQLGISRGPNKSLRLVQTRATVFEGTGLSHLQLTILLIFLGIFGLSIAYFFLKEWARAEKIRSQLEAVQLDTEVKFLKSQVNPHFLFNTLNNLFSMAQKKGNDELADGISKLSGMMRYMIYESNEEKVPLKKEIEYLEDCILLNKLRYADDEAIVTTSYPSDTGGIVVAPMLFIPFVENAFKHGVMIGRPSEIDISISVVNRQLIFRCQNTIYMVKKMENEGGIGLENVKRRLELVYPGKHELFIENMENKYTVSLRITLA